MTLFILREEPNIFNFTPSFVFWMKGAETLMIPYFMFYGYPKKCALLRWMYLDEKCWTTKCSHRARELPHQILFISQTTVHLRLHQQGGQGPEAEGRQQVSSDWLMVWMLSCDWLQHHDDADRGDRGVPGGGAPAVHHDRAAHHLLQVRAAAARQAGLMLSCSLFAASPTTSWTTTWWATSPSSSTWSSASPTPSTSPSTAACHGEPHMAQRNWSFKSHSSGFVKVRVISFLTNPIIIAAASSARPSARCSWRRCRAATRGASRPPPRTQTSPPPDPARTGLT